MIVVTPYSVTYDATAHTATGTATGVNSEALSGLDLSGTEHTNAGTYASDAWTFTSPNGNYNDDSGTVSDNITPLGLTISGLTANNKVYDGNNTATLSGTAALDGVLGGDTVNLGGTPAATFADANVATGKPVSVTGYTVDNSNYSVSQPTSLTADITARAITVTANNQLMVVGDPDPDFTFNASGFVGVDTFVTDPVCTVSDPHTVPGTYTIECSGAVVGANYSLNPYVNGTLTVNEFIPDAEIDVSLGGTFQEHYVIQPGVSMRDSYPGKNAGPVKVISTNAVSILAAERLIYKVKGVNTSFAEMMGLPDNQLDSIYWLPWYNNKDLDTQLRFANVSNSTAQVHVLIGGVEMQGSPFSLLAGESTRKSFPGINAGPVKIVSDQNIVAAERLIYKVNNVNTSFTEMMALPDNALDTTYWLPWYNNKDLDTQLRFANVSNSTAQVQVFVGGVEMQGSPFSLLAGESTRKSFPGISGGPVKIVSDQNIVAAERLIYKVNNVNTSFSEMMALPDSQLNTTYWLPWYNNKDLDTQLRFANVHDSQTATVHVYIGGVEMPNSPFTLLPGESTRQSFANVNNGPVKIVSNVPIVAAERLIYKANNVNTSFTEMMALPDSQLDSIYWLPWYNNVDLDTQLRFGAP